MTYPVNSENRPGLFCTRYDQSKIASADPHQGLAHVVHIITPETGIASGDRWSTRIEPVV